jgi:hypothetical protein
VKLRLINEMDSDHPMPHPFHVHGAGRFLILARDGVVEPNLVWKDTVLVWTGETVDMSSGMPRERVCYGAACPRLCMNVRAEPRAFRGLRPDARCSSELSLARCSNDVDDRSTRDCRESFVFE